MERDALYNVVQVWNARASRPTPRSAIDEIRDKALDGKRLDRAEGRWLLTEAPLLELGALAARGALPRASRSGVVTFVIDTNPNYTNVCITDCQFCAFYRKPGDQEA